MKNLTLFFLTCFIFLGASVDAAITQTNHIQDIHKEIASDTLTLFNIAEVLMDTDVSLGSQAWRKYVRARVESKLHDELTLFVFKNVPPKTPEDATSVLIAKLQSEGKPVFAFTSRGRHEWYGSQIPDIDLVTEDLLRKINIDFSKTQLPPQLAEINTIFSDYYHGGIIYATNALAKGDLLIQLLQMMDYHPAKIVFVDDKADSLKTVEEALKNRNIDFSGFAYSRTAVNHADFDPMVANIQLDWLIKHGEILSDLQAAHIKAVHFANIDPDAYFAEIVQYWKSAK